jgi:hypothetical protein
MKIMKFHKRHDSTDSRSLVNPSKIIPGKSMQRQKKYPEIFQGKYPESNRREIAHYL